MSANDFSAKLASIIPAGANKIASDVWLRISESFAEIEAARERGVSWQQIVDLMVADGLRTLDGKKPTQSVVRAPYHKERYSLGGKRKKRRGSKPAPAAMQHITPFPPLRLLPSRRSPSRYLRADLRGGWRTPTTSSRGGIASDAGRPARPWPVGRRISKLPVRLAWHLVQPGLRRAVSQQLGVRLRPALVAERLAP